MGTTVANVRKYRFFMPVRKRMLGDGNVLSNGKALMSSNLGGRIREVR